MLEEEEKMLQSRALTWRVVAAGCCPGLAGIVSLPWESRQEKLVSASGRGINCKDVDFVVLGCPPHFS